MKRLALLLACLAASQSRAQHTVRVRLIDGESGKPVSGARVTITTFRDFGIKQLQAVSTGFDYTVQLENDSAVGLGSVTESDAAWNQYAQCASGENLRPIYPVATIVTTGIIAPNTCHRHVVEALVPGGIVFFVRHLSLWERLTGFVKAIPD